MPVEPPVPVCPLLPAVIGSPALPPVKLPALPPVAPAVPPVTMIPPVPPVAPPVPVSPPVSVPPEPSSPALPAIPVYPARSEPPIPDVPPADSPALPRPATPLAPPWPGVPPELCEPPIPDVPPEPSPPALPALLCPDELAMFCSVILALPLSGKLQALSAMPAAKTAVILGKDFFFTSVGSTFLVIIVINTYIIFLTNLVLNSYTELSYRLYNDGNIFKRFWKVVNCLLRFQ